MKIIFLMRQDAITKSGGDLIQIQKYIHYLGKIGIDANLAVDMEYPLDDYDIVHLVNIDRPLETWHHYKRARKIGKPVVISPIHHSYNQIDCYEKAHRKGLLKYLNTILPTFTARENLKNIYRGLLSPSLLLPAINLAFSGMTSVQREILRNVDHCCLIAEGEKDLIQFDFELTPRKCSVIYNGIETELERKVSRDKKYDVLVVGRIEARKNPLGILRALKNTSLKIAFVGGINQFHRAYNNQFFKELAENVNATYLGKVPYEQMPEIYGSSKVHLSASWFEVASLVDIEALYYGCNIICSKNGFSSEYLTDKALYVDPSCLGDIHNKVEHALLTKHDENIHHYIRNELPWSNSASVLATIYQEVSHEVSAPQLKNLSSPTSVALAIL